MILLDMQMPNIDGLEANRMIRYRKPAAPLNIIAFTANAMPGDREECLRVGMNDYVSKPLSLNLLRHALKSAFQALYPGHL